MTADFQDKAPRANTAIAPTLTSLKVFAAVGQCLSFTQAGKHLGVTQSAVSRQIRQLQDTLDIALFRRVGNNVFLTEAGALLHERLADAFDVMDDAVRDVRATVPRQKLTVLAPPTFAARWLSRRLKEFQQRFPDLDLSLHTHSDDNVRFDCAIRFGVDPKERYTSTRLMIEQHIAVCAPVLWADPLQLRRSCLLYVLDQSRPLPTWDNWFATTKHDRATLPQNAMEFATLDMVINAAVSGAGLAVVDRNMIASELQSGALVQIDPVVVPGPIGYWLDISGERLSRSRVVHFARWLQQMAATDAEA
ncbi:MAG: DNA-binding transcriptional LysR family regulator [Yoonia sp.]|jgi:DNA-binding transcriptional LysR family regulator